MQVEEVGEKEKDIWHGDPFIPLLKEGRWFARGVGDNLVGHDAYDEAPPIHIPQDRPLPPPTYTGPPCPTAGRAACHAK